MDPKRLLNRLTRRLAFEPCGKCREQGIDPTEGGPCSRCQGEKRLPIKGDRLKRWREAALQEIEAWCLEGEGGTTGGHVLKR